MSDLFTIDPKLENNIFVSHDLCQAQYQISKETLKIKGSIVKAIRIQRGYVHIKMEDGRPFIRILSLDMLRKVTEAASGKKN